MRAMRRIVLGCLCLVVAATLAPAQDDARQVIEKGIKAHGGKDRLSKIKAQQTRTRGTLFIAGTEAPFTAETMAQFPGQIKNSLDCEVQGKKQSLVQIINGDKVYLGVNGQAQALGDKILAEMKEL